MTSTIATIQTRLLRPHEVADFAALVALFAEVFEHDNPAPPGEAHLGRVMQQPHFMAMVATAGTRVVGGLTAYILDGYYTKKQQVYLYDVAVHPDFQRQGIGRKLVDAFIAHCAAASFEEVFVQADGDDAHALDFYRATGASREAAVVHFSYALSGGDAST